MEKSAQHTPCEFPKLLFYCAPGLCRSSRIVFYVVVLDISSDFVIIPCALFNGGIVDCFFPVEKIGFVQAGYRFRRRKSRRPIMRRLLLFWYLSYRSHSHRKRFLFRLCRLLRRCYRCCEAMSSRIHRNILYFLCCLAKRTGSFFRALLYASRILSH